MSKNYDNRKKIAIIGAGFSGLVLGFYLSKKFKVHIYEKESFVGGLLHSFRYKNIEIERYYHHFFRKDKEFLSLIADLDLTDQIEWHQSTNSFVFNNVFYTFNVLADIFHLKFMNIIDQIRFLSGNFLIQFASGSLFDRGKKIFGAGGWDMIWKKMIISKFGKYSAQISCQWLAYRIRQRVLSSNRLGYPKDGFRILISELKDQILKNQGQIFTNYQIKKISKKNVIDNKKYDTIINTIPNLELKKIYNDNFIKIHPYNAVICLIVVSGEKLTDYYWNNVLDNKIIGGIIEQTNFKPIGNRHLTYISKYIESDSKLYRTDNKNLIKLYSKELAKILDHKNFDIIKVFKNRFAQPIVAKKSDIIGLELAENFYSTNMENIYPQDRGLNEAVKNVKRIIKIINEKS